ncbi:hypothetical protein B0H14DRAFT_2597249 [Mycena olivaceomarginata]|nr:hypothetical protein B0H14DRAFT_2597249 [Mycena olivaceomarginata]
MGGVCGGNSHYRSTGPALALDRAEGECWGRGAGPAVCNAEQRSNCIQTEERRGNAVVLDRSGEAGKARKAGGGRQRQRVAAVGGKHKKQGREAGGEVQEESWWDGKGGWGRQRQRAAAVGGKQGKATATETNNCNLPAQIRYQNKLIPT